MRHNHFFIDFFLMIHLINRFDFLFLHNIPVKSIWLAQSLLECLFLIRNHHHCQWLASFYKKYLRFDVKLNSFIDFMIIQFTFIYFDQLKDYFLTSTISTGLQNEILVTKQEYNEFSNFFSSATCFVLCGSFVRFDTTDLLKYFQNLKVIKNHLNKL